MTWHSHDIARVAAARRRGAGGGVSGGSDTSRASGTALSHHSAVCLHPCSIIARSLIKQASARIRAHTHMHMTCRDTDLLHHHMHAPSRRRPQKLHTGPRPVFIHR
jgi:hypothetical protein